MDAQVTVNFVCQRCHQPILLDEGFSHLNEHTIAELSLPLFAKSGDIDFKDLPLDKLILSRQLQESHSQTHGFTIVGDAPDSERSQPSKITTTLFDLVSSNSDLDHPLCEECTDIMIKIVDTQLVQEQNQAAAYAELIDSLPEFDKENVNELKNELEKLQLEELCLMEELERIEAEQSEAQSTLSECLETKNKLEKEEHKLWNEYCTYKSDLNEQEEENKKFKCLVTHMNSQLNYFTTKSIFTTTFHLWHSCHFGCINNLRLGRLPTVPVGWPEINAAWGQTVLLLQSLANHVNLRFTKYKLVPFGNASYIEVIGENKELPLHRCGGLRFLWDHKFDAGMVAFLECMSQFQSFVESKCPRGSKPDPKQPFCLPYKINKHFIEDPLSKESFSIKMQFNSEEQWTKGLKYLLTNLNWCITWVSSSTFN